MDISLIDATLKYGEFKYLNRKKIIIEVAVWVFSSLLLYAAAIVSIIIVNENKYAYFTFFLVAPTIILTVVFIWYVFITRRIKEIQLWLQDAVEINAVTAKAGEDFSVAMLTPITLYKLQVDFDYNGRHYTYFSKNEYKIKFDSPPTGFHKIWERYINKNVKIMYSPKYDEVMLVRGSAKDFLKPLYGNNNKRK